MKLLIENCFNFTRYNLTYYCFILTYRELLFTIIGPSRSTLFL
jgi:hypothetical protein